MLLHSLGARSDVVLRPGVDLGAILDHALVSHQAERTSCLLVWVTNRERSAAIDPPGVERNEVEVLADNRAEAFSQPVHEPDTGASRAAWVEKQVLCSMAAAEGE